MLMVFGKNKTFICNHQTFWKEKILFFPLAIKTKGKNRAVLPLCFPIFTLILIYDFDHQPKFSLVL